MVAKTKKLYRIGYWTELLFHQQYYAKLYHFTQLEVTPNFYVASSTLYANKIRINLLRKKLVKEH